MSIRSRSLAIHYASDILCGRMLFNSIEFACLMLLVVPAYFALRRWSHQNILLLAASYVFYGWWDYRFVGLLVTSTITDYLVARRLEHTENPRRRKALVALSCCVNLGLLGTFKYGGLLTSTANGIGHWLGIESAILPQLQLVLPIGISFYTFQTMAYTIDVYRRSYAPCHSLRDFALYVSFFPQLVAGPIERPGRLLPTITSRRRVRSADIEEGVFLFASGWFRKSLGDVMGTLVDPTFADPASLAAWPLLWGTYAFSFQVYLDFSGYTDMARGTARLLGFNLMINFKTPYFSKSMSEFWRRWHISLSSWFLDYVFIPLGGSRGATWRVLANLMTTMFLAGLWHGAGWNYAVWGMILGLQLVVERLIAGSGGEQPGKRFGFLGRVTRMVIAFHMLWITWPIFLAQPTAEKGAFAMAWDHYLGFTHLLTDAWVAPPREFWLWVVVLVIDVLIERSGDQFFCRRWSWPARAVIIATLAVLGFLLGSGESRAFIYFQF